VIAYHLSIFWGINTTYQIFSDRTAAETKDKCSLFDPYTGRDAGYVQVTPLLGTLPPLLVLPVGQCRWKAGDSSQNQLPMPPTTNLKHPRVSTSGNFIHPERVVKSHTLECPTSTTLKPGATRTYGVQFRLGLAIREVENAVQGAGRPGCDWTSWIYPSH
jgi:hypothetical protein